jgi:hypothetical protein
VIQVVSVGSSEAGVFAVGQEAKGVIAIGQVATGFIAIGQEATGFIAVGQEATGFIAVGQLARGVIAVGQLALGVVAVGMAAGGVLWCAAMVGVAGTSGPGLVYGLLGRARIRQCPWRVLALVRREPWDTTRHARSAWRRVLGALLLPGLIALWWFLAGQSAVATVR